MISVKKLKEIALSFDSVTEEPHFEKISFRIKKMPAKKGRPGKIFATYDTATNLACVKFNTIDQASFCSFDKKVMFPVPNKWGQMGWTQIDLGLVKEEMLLDALTTSYLEAQKSSKR